MCWCDAEPRVFAIATVQQLIIFSMSFITLTEGNVKIQAGDTLKEFFYYYFILFRVETFY